MAPTGPNSSIRLARASPSIKGGGFVNLSLRRYLHVTRIGIAAFLGGTITRTPLCLHPRIAPPRASTRNETRKLSFAQLRNTIIDKIRATFSKGKVSRIVSSWGAFTIYMYRKRRDLKKYKSAWVANCYGHGNRKINYWKKKKKKELLYITYAYCDCREIIRIMLRSLLLVWVKPITCVIPIKKRKKIFLLLNVQIYMRLYYFTLKFGFYIFQRIKRQFFPSLNIWNFICTLRKKKKKRTRDNINSKVTFTIFNL